MKKIKFLFLLIFIFFILHPKLALAHVLKTDGNIGAILHIDPDDDPIAGSPSSFFFEFKDKQNQFNPADCDCNISIIEDGKQIYSQPLFQNNSNPSLDNASLSYTFPERNVYQVIVTGKPNTPGEFQTFSLTYDVRVARVADATTSTTAPANNTTSWISQHIPHIIGLLIVLVFLILAVIKQIKRPKPDVEAK